MAKKKTAPRDPAREANQQVLEQRQERIDAQMREIPDLGLNLDSEAHTASEFLRDEWDKKAFGDEAKTVTKWVYGPDPLLDSCPAFKEAIERHGIEAYAEATYKAILLYEHKAVPDPVMQKGLFKGIQKFGKERLAQAFKERIEKIPARQVEYEIGPEGIGDPAFLGSNALRDCVVKYGRPGMAYKFLSPRCIDVLGTRGYALIKDEHGDPVKAGTLLMGEIPQHVADARREKFARESEQLVREQEDQYRGAQERLLQQAGPIGKGSRPLDANELVTATASESQDRLGESFQMGLRIEREG